MKRRVLSVFLSLCMMVSVMSAMTVTASATTSWNGFDFATGNLAARLDTIIKSGISTGVSPSMPKVGGNFSPSKKYKVSYTNQSGSWSGYQCVAYAEAAYNYLFGYNCGDSKYRVEFNAKKRNTLTYNDFATWGVTVGAYLRTTGSSDGSWNASNGHSLIILKYDKTHVYSIEANSVGSQYAVQIKQRTWNNFNKELLSGQKRYVCSFSQPTSAIYKNVGYSLPSISSTETGSWTVTVPANYKVLCYSSANAMTSCDYRKARTSANTITCTQKATLSNGTVRYYYTTDDGRGLWFDFISSMSVKAKTQSAASSNNTSTTKPPVTPVTSTLKINLTTKPTTITQGNSFGLYGTVSSNYKITKVQGSVVNASGKTVLSTTDTPNSTSMNINTANLNKKLTFNTLPAGKYTLKIVATDSKKSVDLTQSFTVVKTTLKINLTSYPTSIKKGSSYGLRGTVSSNAKITKVQGYVINSSGKTVLSSTDTPNKTSMDIRTANLNNKLAFNKLAVGTYTMKVVATDTSGNSVTWSKTFKVTK